MTCPFNKDSLSQLKGFVEVCRSNPNLLHLDELGFFREYLESLGGSVPEKKAEPDMPKTKEAPHEGAPKEERDAEEKEAESDPESELEFDNEGCIEADELSDTQKMGDEDKQPSEEECDKADELRTKAMSEFGEGNFEKTVELLTEAIETNPQSAILYTKRGQAYIRLNRPNACIKDCSHALRLNCDSAPAYKFRGRAYRLLGDWENAARDLRQAVKIDFDEQANEWLKEVQPNALKIEQHRLKQERKRADREERERRERVRKAREAHAKAAEGGGAAPEPSAGEGGAQPGMDFYKLMQDPEIIAAFQDPEVAAAFQDISTNPANIMKYQSNPKVQALIQKLSSKFSKSGMGFPGGFGFPGAGGGFPGAGGAGAAPQDDGLD